MTNDTNIWELAEYSKRNKRINRAKYLFVLFVHARYVRSVCSKRLFVGQYAAKCRMKVKLITGKR